MSGTLQKRKYIYELDYIRAISALFIVLFHYTTQYETSIGHIVPWPVSVPWGSRAVNTFFLLTGYLTVCHYAEGGLRFMGKRFIRLWPAFAVCVVLTSLCMAVLFPERLRTVSEILRNFTMFPGYLGARTVDGVYWTLPVEILFYFWIMVLMLGRKKGLLLFSLYGWITVAIAAAVCNRAGILSTPVKLLKMGFIVQYAHCFLLGAGIHLMNVGSKKQRWLTAPLLILCIVGTWLWQKTGVTVWTAFWALLIWGVTSGKMRFAMGPGNPVHKCILFLARISYTLYLLHQFIGFAIIRKIEAMGGSSELWIFVPIAVSLLLAAAVHYLVEVPAGKLLMKLIPKKKSEG